VPVVLNERGEKLSKQTGAAAFDNGASVEQLLATALLPAARWLGMDLRAASIAEFWRAALPAWDRLMLEHRVPGR